MDEGNTDGWDAFTYCLSPKVMAVAKTRPEGTWAAYIDVIAGSSLEADTNAVLAMGSKVAEHIAREMFPQFKELPYAQ